MMPLAVLLLISLLLPCHGQREQSGDIFEETVWTVEDSPVVLIIQDIIVVEPGSLTINPGVHVNFNGSFSILVRGSVVLNGSESDPVRVSNGFKAFHLMDEIAGASLTAQHTIFENHSGGAIMREWHPQDQQLPLIQVDHCTFVNNEYAIRSYHVELTDSTITGGRIGVSLHKSTITNVAVQDIDEICIFAGQDSQVTGCNIANCGTIGLQIEGVAQGVSVTNAGEGIAAVLAGWDATPQNVEVRDCVLQQIREIGLKHIPLVEGTVVFDSPDAIGAVMETGLLSRSIVVGNRVGVATNAVTGNTASTIIEDSYVCGNSEAQFDALQYSGTSNATRVYFGDTVAASEDGTLGELLQALPFLPTAMGFLNYDISDSNVQNMNAFLDQADVLATCQITGSQPTPATAAPSTQHPSTPMPTEPPMPPPAPVLPQQKLAPREAKCGSLATSRNRGGAAAQSKSCIRMLQEGKKRRIRGL